MAILVLTSAETGAMIATTSEQKSYDEDGFYRMFFREPAVGVSPADRGKVHPITSELKPLKPHSR